MIYSCVLTYVLKLACPFCIYLAFKTIAQFKFIELCLGSDN